jgi:Peroxiredoxin
MMRSIYWLSLLFILGFIPKTDQLRNGSWKAILLRKDGVEIPFNFRTESRDGKKILYVKNAGEELLVDEVTVKEDSVFINLPFFESSIKAKLDIRGNLSGLWYKRLSDHNQVMPFSATYNTSQRFQQHTSASKNITGRWAVIFNSGNDKPSPAVGEFQQDGNKVSGTFLTPGGDYRFLQGVVDGDSLKMSTFDGGHAFLFTALIKDNHTITEGKYYSGISSPDNWTANKNDQAALPDGYDQTHLKSGEDHLNFHFKSIDGKEVSINDPVYKNKVIVIQIMGSWCPNCMDETNFLSQYYHQNKSRGVEIIALAYERSEDFNRSVTSINRFRNRFHVEYPMLVTGVTLNDPLKTEKTLPQLDNIKVFPTSIFIDKKGKVRKIYSGFEGPGTGQHYQDFQKEFNQTINSLLAEQ